ncbi:MAG TPA: hypothetical protein VGH28_27130 [Polyangiaceae bacterium]|jgi:hypothetical protein
MGKESLYEAVSSGKRADAIRLIEAGADVKLIKEKTGKGYKEIR